MADLDNIVGVITLIENDEYNNKPFKRVTLGTGQVLKVKQGREGALMAKWGLLKEGVAVVFKMREYKSDEGNKFPFVHDIELVAKELQPPQEPTMLEEHKEVIQEARNQATKKEPTRSEEIAHHVAMKELGEMIRAGKITNTGATKPYWNLYWLWLSHTLGVKPEKD